jgi:hypothetical protein
VVSEAINEAVDFFSRKEYFAAVIPQAKLKILNRGLQSKNSSTCGSIAIRVSIEVNITSSNNHPAAQYAMT